jgi:hypothetical protein
VVLKASAVRTDDALISVPGIDQECLVPPPAAPIPPAPVGACDAAEARLAVKMPEAATTLRDPPLGFRADSAGIAPFDRFQTGLVKAPSQPPSLLDQHGAISGQREEAVTTYRFPSHETARAFHEDAVARACAQAIEAFAVPGVPDAVGLRLYVPARGPECDYQSVVLWRLEGLNCEWNDWVVDYVAFVRGQYHLSAVVSAVEQRPQTAVTPQGPDLAGQRDAVLGAAADASLDACRAVSYETRRNCRPVA